MEIEGGWLIFQFLDLKYDIDSYSDLERYDPVITDGAGDRPKTDSW